MVYWVFSESTTGGNLTAVAKGTLSADERRIENATIIYRATPAYNNTMHYGGRILVDKSGNLLSVRVNDQIYNPQQAQQLNSALGKIVRITKDGQPAQGNLSLARQMHGRNYTRMGIVTCKVLPFILKQVTYGRAKWDQEAAMR
jgi:glucose/arabinose dehydrogenase